MYYIRWIGQLKGSKKIIGAVNLAQTDHKQEAERLAVEMNKIYRRGSVAVTQEPLDNLLKKGWQRA